MVRRGAPSLDLGPPLSNRRECAINSPNHTCRNAISSRAADAQKRLLRRVLMAFVLLGLTLLAMSAHACRIEHSNSNTVTIRGECGEAVLMSHLSIAIAQLETRGELTRAHKSSSDSDKPKPTGRVDLINGVAKGAGTTVFHRPPSKK